MTSKCSRRLRRQWADPVWRAKTLRSLRSSARKRRGTSKWAEIRKKWPRELVAFFGCHNRVRDGKCSRISFPREVQGFLNWIKEIGRRPTNMFRPSVGRKSHKIGYVNGNIQWEEHSVNSVKRRGTRWEKSRARTIPIKRRMK